VCVRIHVCALQQRSARMADAAEEEHALSALAPLPHAVVLLIFALLPVDLRARCACVCRAWRAAVSERSLWTRLDVSRTSGVTARVTDALLREAAARAGGALQALDVSGRRRVSHEALLTVVTANAATLRELRVCHGVRLNVNFNPAVVSSVPLGHVEALLRAAPQLRVLELDVACDSIADARRALCAEGLLSPLCAHGLRVYFIGAAEAEVLVLAADVAAHAWLKELNLLGALPTRAALDAVVDAALARRLSSIEFSSCRLSPASAPSLARLLTGSTITELSIWGNNARLLDAPAAVLLADALHANAILTALHLHVARLWDDVAAACTLLGALTAHPSLRTLSVSENSAALHTEAERTAAGAALGALLAANAPALTELDISVGGLGDAGLAPLLQALPRNTRLRTLKCATSFMTDVFATNTLLPAVRANTSLRELHADAGILACVEAMELVSERS
jgi:hypothetical protein